MLHKTWQTDEGNKQSRKDKTKAGEYFNYNYFENHSQNIFEVLIVNLCECSALRSPAVHHPTYPGHRMSRGRDGQFCV